MNVESAVELFLSDLDSRELSKAHRKNTIWRVYKLCEPWLDWELAELSRAALTGRVQALEEFYAEASIAGLVQGAKAMFKFLFEQGVLPENLADHLRPRSYRSKMVKAAPQEVVAQLEAAIPAFVQQRDDHPRDVRDALTVMLSLQSGSRLSGIVNLQRSHMLEALKRPFATGSGRVAYRVPTKSKGRRVELVFYSETAELFELWEKVRPRFPKEPDRVFTSLKTGKVLLARSVSQAFTRLSLFAGVPITRSHAIRHRNVTDLMRAGADPKVAAAYAGHSSEAVTMAHYRHLVGSEVEDAMAQVLDKRQDESAFQDDMLGLFGLDG